MSTLTASFVETLHVAFSLRRSGNMACSFGICDVFLLLVLVDPSAIVFYSHALLCSNDLPCFLFCPLDVCLWLTQAMRTICHVLCTCFSRRLSNRFLPSNPFSLVMNYSTLTVYLLWIWNICLHNSQHTHWILTGHIYKHCCCYKLLVPFSHRLCRRVNDLENSSTEPSAHDCYNIWLTFVDHDRISILIKPSFFAWTAEDNPEIGFYCSLCDFWNLFGCLRHGEPYSCEHVS